jgi:HNH endonuclease
VVHHENGNTKDNRPENITVCSSQRAHVLYEKYQQREQAGKKHLFTVDELLAMFGMKVYR